MRNSITELGAIIRQRREVLGILQPQLAGLSGISTRTIQLVEQGKGNPSLDTLLKLAQTLGLQLKLELLDPSKNNEA
jgi:y4mF family transcriptional regulator